MLTFFLTKSKSIQFTIYIGLQWAQSWFLQVFDRQTLDSGPVEDIYTNTFLVVVGDVVGPVECRGGGGVPGQGVCGPRCWCRGLGPADGDPALHVPPPLPDKGHPQHFIHRHTKGQFRFRKHSFGDWVNLNLLRLWVLPLKTLLKTLTTLTTNSGGLENIDNLLWILENLGY